MKKVLFLCGSTKGKESSSYAVGWYMSHFLDYDYEFIDVAAVNLSYEASEAEPAFVDIVNKITYFIQSPQEIGYFILGWFFSNSAGDNADVVRHLSAKNRKHLLTFAPDIQGL